LVVKLLQVTRVLAWDRNSFKTSARVLGVDTQNRSGEFRNARVEELSTGKRGQTRVVSRWAVRNVTYKSAGAIGGAAHSEIIFAVALRP